MEESIGGFFLLLGFLVLAALYFIPSIVAVMRRHPQIAPIIIVNIFLGWTLIGFVVALAWSFSNTDSRVR